MSEEECTLKMKFDEDSKKIRRFVIAIVRCRHCGELQMGYILSGGVAGYKISARCPSCESTDTELEGVCQFRPDLVYEIVSKNRFGRRGV